MLDNPEHKNALAGTMREELGSHLELIAKDKAIHAIVLRGEGAAFCSGTDLARLAELQARPDGAEELGRMLDVASSIVEHLVCDVPQPTLAALRGPIVGAGLGIALACDYRLAADDALIATGFAAMGLHPDWGSSFFLPRRLGAARALDLVLGNRRLGAPQALAAGLVDEVVPVADHDAAWRARARKWSEAALPAQRAIVASLRGVDRAALRAALGRERAIQIECFRSDASRDRVRAFLDRT